MSQYLLARGEAAQAARPVGQRRDAWPFLSVPFLAFLILPIVALLLRATPDRLFANLGQPQVLQAISLSLVTTLAATGITIVFGTPVAYLLAQRRVRLRRAIDTLIDLPTVLPPSVAGIALLMAFGRRGLMGGSLADLGIDIAFTPFAVILAQVFIGAPFYIRSAMVGFAAVSAEIMQAAAIDGASGRQTFRFVTVPLSWSALISGSVMTWARALGEFGATIIFAGNFPGRTQTMPLAIYIGFELDLDVALTLSVILVGCSFLVLMIVKGLLQRERPI
jgi:molybdate transport system permease protein